MKRLTMMIFIILVIGQLHAQDNHFKRNELSVSYGYGTATEFGNLFADAMSTLFAGKSGYIGDNSFSGSFNLEYIYHLNKIVGVGAIFTYEHSNSDLLTDNIVQGDSKENYFTFMPVAKLNWHNGKLVKLYSKIAIGITFDNCTQIYNGKEATDRYTNFAFQASPIGIEIGSTVCGFAELGYGQQGIIQAGIKVKF